jgi:branched-chain amino acid transport system substrate-binding protein
LVCIDDETNPKLVPDIYRRLLDEVKVDLVIGGYRDNSVSPAMPLVMERNRYFVALPDGDRRRIHREPARQGGQRPG